MCAQHPDGPPPNQWREAAAARVDFGAAAGLRRRLCRREHRPHHHCAQRSSEGAAGQPGPI